MSLSSSLTGAHFSISHFRWGGRRRICSSNSFRVRVFRSSSSLPLSTSSRSWNGHTLYWYAAYSPEATIAVMKAACRSQRRFSQGTPEGAGAAEEGDPVMPVTEAAVVTPAGEGLLVATPFDLPCRFFRLLMVPSQNLLATVAAGWC